MFSETSLLRTRPKYGSIICLFVSWLVNMLIHVSFINNLTLKFKFVRQFLPNVIRQTCVTSEPQDVLEGQIYIKIVSNKNIH